jgi:Ohr subfamily peroxiredoxin
MAKILYSTEATTTTGRGGAVASTDGRLDLQLSAPKELGGDGGPGTNPEQLFAAAYAACFHTALRATLESKSLAGHEAFVSVTVGIFKYPEGYRLDVKVSASVPTLPREEADLCIAEADVLCPFSDALRGNAVVELTTAP